MVYSDNSWQEIEEVLLKANSVGNSIGCSVQFAGD